MENNQKTEGKTIMWFTQYPIHGLLNEHYNVGDHQVDFKKQVCQ